jgi:serine/threonine protein kinase
MRSDPESIGPFKLAARLGSGGMGIVYLATRGSHSVALKVLNPGSLDVPEHRGRFLRETDALRAISSPNVAKVIDAGTDGDLPWLAVEFINGPDLRSWVEDRGPLSGPEWLALAEGLLKGLVAIHEKGLIHRDIKPANILMSESGPKIIDFGIAQDLDATSVTVTGTVAGSPAWLSPEQIDGDTLTPASDLFSFGSVLAFAATGQSPWGNQSTTTSVVFNRILNKEPSLEEVSEAQRVFIQKLLVKNPPDRPTGKKALTLLPKSIEAKPPQQARATSKTKVTEEAQEGNKTRTGWLFKWRRGTKSPLKATMVEKRQAAQPADAATTAPKTLTAKTPTFVSTQGDLKTTPKLEEKRTGGPERRPNVSVSDPAKTVKPLSRKGKFAKVAIVAGSTLFVGTLGGFAYLALASSFGTNAETKNYVWIPKADSTMPDFKGKPLSEVKRYLVSIGISGWEDIEVNSDLPPGRVASTLPRAGEPVDVLYWNSYKTLDKIKIFVSDGSPTVKDSRSFTAGGTWMGQTGSKKENGDWAFEPPTIGGGILKIPVTATFEKYTTVLVGRDCTVLISKTFERGCGLPRYDSMSIPQNVKVSFPFQVTLEDGIKEPEEIEITFKIRDAQGTRDFKLEFTIAYWD